MDELNAKYVGKFLGEDKITDLSLSSFKTSNGLEIFDVTFENGQTSPVSLKGLVFATDEKRDASKLYETKLNLLSSEYVKIIEDYDIPAYLFERVALRITNELLNHLERAFVIKWHGDAKRYSPNFALKDTVSFLEIERVNQSVPINENEGG